MRAGSYTIAVSARNMPSQFVELILRFTGLLERPVIVLKPDAGEGPSEPREVWLTWPVARVQIAVRLSSEIVAFVFM